jgi:hypothetical protein
MHRPTCQSLLRSRPRGRRGNVLVLTAFMLICLMALMAFAVDLGYVYVSSAELQRTADSAAIAAAWELIDKDFGASPNLIDDIPHARTVATSFVGYNPVCSKSPNVDQNDGNSADGDLVFGYLADVTDPTQPIDLVSLGQSNAVQVRVRRTSDMNGEVPFFFARALGFNSVPNRAQATAVVASSFNGFQAPADGGNLDLLPFALDIDTWNDLLNGGGQDQWQREWDDATNEWTVSKGGDGVNEVNLFPQGTGSPGNRGTVDIGGSNNSTCDIARQITDGVSPADLAHHGGQLEFDANGQLPLNGDTGISAGVKDELASIIGQPRMIPIFESVSGPGNNATYTIVKFVGVSVLEVKLTGSMSSKRVTIQPAYLVTGGGIPTPGGSTSQFVYSRPYLIH